MTSEAGGAAGPGSGIKELARDGALVGQWKLDPQASHVEFRVRHFWSTITVRGSFERVEGDGTVSPDGTATGQIVIDARSLNTRNKQRDKHLRSDDFFAVEKHPRVVLSVIRASLTSDGRLAAEGTLEAADHQEPVSFTADITEARPDTVTLRAELTVDRSRFGMTWSPMRISSMQATGSFTARFTRPTSG
jgi:polyisoprenoid-binding protein YceI